MRYTIKQGDTLQSIAEELSDRPAEMLENLRKRPANVNELDPLVPGKVLDFRFDLLHPAIQAAANAAGIVNGPHAVEPFLSGARIAPFGVPLWLWGVGAFLLLIR